MFLFFFFKQKTAYEISACLVGSEMCIRDRLPRVLDEQQQGVEEPRREIQCTAVTTAHLLLRWLQHEVTESIAGRCELGELSHLSGTFQGAANDFQGRSAHCAGVGRRAAPA